MVADRPFLRSLPVVAVGLLTSLVLVVLPVWQEVAHGDSAHGQLGHGEGHHLAASSHDVADHAQSGHGDCDSWATQTREHHDHSDLQFELAEASCHQHHGVCTGHSSLTGHAGSPRVELGTDSASSGAVGQLLAPRGRSATQPPSRGPPLV